MKIWIDQLKDSVCIQMFDSLYALKQSETPRTNYQTDVVISKEYSSDTDVKILYTSMPEDFQNRNLSMYDLIFICNNGESLDTATELIPQTLATHNHAYILSNSHLHPDHELYGRVLWFCYNIPNCRDYWNRPFYPQFYEHEQKQQTIKRNQGIMVINGANRSWRYHAINTITKVVPDIKVRSSITKDNLIEETLQAFWESEQDRQFREYVNSYYDISPSVVNNYYDNSIQVGIDQRFGSIPPGYIILDEYYQYQVIVFTERSWLNHELAITEKSLKCFMAGSLPFPIGGCYINQMYNQLGFYTAWNLLPGSLRAFDSTVDHLVRYNQMAQAVDWLHKNLDTIDPLSIDRLVQHNRHKFLAGGNGTDLNMLRKLTGV